MLINDSNNMAKTKEPQRTFDENQSEHHWLSKLLPVITKTNLHNFDTLKPHFYIAKLGFTGVYIIFLMSA